MTPEHFAELAQQGYNRIPVMREVLADLDTPLSSYLKLASGPYSYLFESVQGGEKWGRYSMIGLPARTILKAFGDEIQVERDGEIVERHTRADALSFVDEFKQRYRAPELPGLPRFTGGLVGYFAYDCVRYVEPHLKASMPKDIIGTPDILLSVSDEVLVFDNLAGKLIFVIHANPEVENAYAKANARLDELEAKLRGEIPATPSLSLGMNTHSEAKFQSHFGEKNFHDVVDKIKEYVLSGDTMQVVISQRLSIDFTQEPINLYRALRNLNPSPYMYFMDLGDHHVVGSSPEILARLEDGEVTVRPIAGTRRRGYTPEEDKALEIELVNDPKEIAEHNMLVDLHRNDLGRVARPGTVKVRRLMDIKRFSHVQHISSEVVGIISRQHDMFSGLASVFPAGTLSGAPKIESMKIIERIEADPRGPYGGAVGHFGFNGDCTFAIPIRSLFLRGDRGFLRASGGIVFDSTPEGEYAEIQAKLASMRKALAPFMVQV